MMLGIRLFVPLTLIYEVGDTLRGASLAVILITFLRILLV
jgi:hypothetical protein